MFYPFYNNFRTVNSFGIPVIRTIYSSIDVTNKTITYGICPRIWKQLPCEGVFILNVTNSKPATTVAGSLVFIDTCKYVSQVTSPSTTSVTVTPLINGSGTQMPTEEIIKGNRYLVYFNKANGILLVINHIK